MREGIRMKLKIFLCLLLVLFTTSMAHARLKVDFTFKDLEGNVYTPGTFKGKPAVIYVGSTF